MVRPMHTPQTFFRSLADLLVSLLRSFGDCLNRLVGLNNIYLREGEHSCVKLCLHPLRPQRKSV